MITDALGGAEVFFPDQKTALGWATRSCQTEAELFQGLAPSERNYVDTLLVPGRRLDFAWGRHVARKTVRALGFDQPFSILPGALGQPVLHGPVNLRLSISHAGGLAVVAASTPDFPVAIDWEPWADHEGKDLGAWTAREALGKWLQVGLAVPTTVLDVVCREDGPNGQVWQALNFPTLHLETFDWHNGVLAVVHPRTRVLAWPPLAPTVRR